MDEAGGRTPAPLSPPPAPGRLDEVPRAGVEARIVLLPGDGIGPEVVAAGRRVLEAVAARFGHRLRFEAWDIGGAAIDAAGDPLPPETLAACRAADALLLGAVGGPRWDDPTAAVRPEQGLLRLRKALDLFANLRPVRPFPALAGASPLRPELLAGVDLLIVRELTGGLYFGEPRRRERLGGTERAIDTLIYTEPEVRRVAELAFGLAAGRRGRLVSVDKANVLESSRLWRQVVESVAQAYPAVDFEHQLVDSAAMRLISEPQSFDVLLTENLFGDILSDEAAVLASSLGLLPSAALGTGRPGLFEPVHGSAPDIAGNDVANPLGAILSAALLLRYGLQLEPEANAVEAAVDAALEDGARTADLGGSWTTSELTDHIIARLAPETSPAGGELLNQGGK